MPHTKNTRFNLAQFMKAHKVAREKAVDENRKLSAEYKKVQRAQEKLATVREHFKDITNELDNIPVSILLILYCGCFTSTSKYAAKNCWAQPPTKSVGLH
ncbi:3 flap structured DNA binding [Porites harrisoni]